MKKELRRVTGKFICFRYGKAKLYPIKGIKPNIDFDNAIVEVEIKKLKQQQLSVHKINTVLWKASDEWNNTHGENERGYLFFLSKAIIKDQQRK